MADVQIENGYTKIANELLEKLAQIKLSPTQYRLLFVIWRFTYGFNRKEHELSLSFFVQNTGLDIRNVRRELKNLEERNIIFQDTSKPDGRTIGFNKDYDSWDNGTGESTQGQNHPWAKPPMGETDNSDMGEFAHPPMGETAQEEIKGFKENIKETSTSSSPRETHSIDAVHARIFNHIQMSGLLSSLIASYKTQGFSDHWICEVLLEAAESSSTGKPSVRLIESIASRWKEEGINSREDNRSRRNQTNSNGIATGDRRHRNRGRPATKPNLPVYRPTEPAKPLTQEEQEELERIINYLDSGSNQVAVGQSNN